MLLSDLIDIFYDCWLRQVHYEYTTIFSLQMFKGDNWHISLFGKQQQQQQKPIPILIISLWIYIFIVGFTTLTLFPGHMCVTNVNSNCAFSILA